MRTNLIRCSFESATSEEKKEMNQTVEILVNKVTSPRMNLGSLSAARKGIKKVSKEYTDKLLQPKVISPPSFPMPLFPSKERELSTTKAISNAGIGIRSLVKEQ